MSFLPCNNHHPARRGGSFFRFISSVVMFSICIVLGWGVFANWNQDANRDGQPDGFTFRLLDPQWWGQSRTEAQPVIEKSVTQLKRITATVREDVWGSSGIIAEAKEWITQHRSNGSLGQGSADKNSTHALPKHEKVTPKQNSNQPTPTNTEKSGDVVAVSPGTRRMEEQIANAEATFHEGLEHYKAGLPPEHGWTKESIAEIAKAQDCFKRVRGILIEQDVVGRYKEAPDHNPVVLQNADKLRALNQRLLSSANKIGSY